MPARIRRGVTMSIHAGVSSANMECLVHQMLHGNKAISIFGNQSMKDFSHYKEVGRTTNTVVYIAESDPDILIVVMQEGTIDNAKDARENVTYFHSYARSLGKPCGCLVIMSNMFSQDAEARRVYQGMDTDLCFAAGLVVENALSRALGSFFVGLSRPNVPTRLFDRADKAIEWLKTMRRKSVVGGGHA